jgi:hypothetical protein
MPQLAFLAGITVFIASLAAEANRQGADWASLLFYVSVAVFILPVASRIVLADVSRWERLSLVLLAAIGLFLIRIIHEPAYFVDHDAFLHWATANDILKTGHLFKPNPLLPISPVYPGLEIVVTALTELSGLPLFLAAQLFMFIIRLVFICALFLFYEHVSNSSRIAAIAVLIYMGASSFVFFDTMFSYGSLALVFMAIAFLVDIKTERTAGYRAVIFIAIPILAALAVTHHLTSFLTSLILASFAALEIIRFSSSRSLFRILIIPIAAMAFTIGWSNLIGNPSEAYLGPVFGNAIDEAMRFLSFEGGRLPFVAEDGTVAPAWQRITTMLSVLLICIGLATSFFRALARAGVPVLLGKLPRRWRAFIEWRNDRLVALTLVAFAYPLSIVLRMTRAGWEVGNRIGPFAFLGVGIVIAIGIATYWQGDSKNRARAALLGTAIAVAVIAGIFSGSGNYILGSARYRVSADSASVEPMAISASEWTRKWLGTGHRFFSDRTNRLLLATYGGQQVITTLYDRYDLGSVEFARKIGPGELLAIRETTVDYFLLDMRLTEQLPLMGFYFDPGPVYREPPDPAVLFKFNKLAGVSRVFDNGYISIVDVARFRDNVYAQ